VHRRQLQAVRLGRRARPGVRRPLAVHRPGQPGARLDASPLANPYRPRDFGGERGATLPHYRRWLWRQIQAGNQEVLQALGAVTEESVLVCYCAPGPCHGEVVRGAAAWLRERS
jgi:hypothetical protein